ncbi:hypothetical protein C8Q80DRAFT_455343 [Daedaleopsis nitida]|nr:hypothetical protein C8Q80DRAFT_455343 [Daedaleopsis nitida]
MAQHQRMNDADKAAPTHVEIYTIAQKAIDMFKSHGLRACIFGSNACSLHGVGARARTPNDVDIVVFTAYRDAEALKRLLMHGDTNFFLLPSRAPRATHKVLWYQFRMRGAAHHRKCKVDVLLPGGMTSLHVPLVPKAHVATINGLPVMPLFPLLLLRLQGWEHHRVSRRADFRAKMPADVAAVEALLLKVAERRPNGTWSGCRST